MTLAVIIPNYNNEKYLSKCLDSVLSQTLLPNEIIVVDDSSTDNSVSIIKEYEEKSCLVKGVFLEKNAGVSHARNTGIKTSKSEYVTTLDADDFYYSNEKLSNELSLLEKYNGQVVAYSKIVYCDEEDNIIRYLDYKNKDYFEGNIFKSLLQEKIGKTLMRDCVYPKKVLLDAGLYDENCSLFEDYDVLIKLAKSLPFYCTFEYGTAYRQKEGGLSSRSQEDLINAKNKIINNALSSLNLTTKISIKTSRNIRKSLYKIYLKIR